MRLCLVPNMVLLVHLESNFELVVSNMVSWGHLGTF